MELTVPEIRVLGSLLEKEATTPDNYPLSTNALTAACNQSTNRDPVMRYRDAEVDAVMLSLRDQRLARTVRGDGQRVHKHKHVLGEAWGLDGGSLAVLSVLMLRGAQTAAEVRARTERYGVDGGSVEGVLVALAEGDRPFVARVPRRPGEREGRWTHLLGGDAPAEDEASEDPTRAPSAAPASSSPLGAAAAAASVRGGDVAALTDRVEQLSRALADAVARLDALERELGLDPAR